jgi:hypothetical protein
VPPDHDTPAAAAKPSTDDTHVPASTTVRASDSTAAVAEKLLALCSSCMERLSEDIVSWVGGDEFSGDVDAVKAAAEREDAKAQHTIGFMMLCSFIPGDGVMWLANAAAQGYADKKQASCGSSSSSSSSAACPAESRRAPPRVRRTGATSTASPRGAHTS